VAQYNFPRLPARDLTKFLQPEGRACGESLIDAWKRTGNVGIAILLSQPLEIDRAIYASNAKTRFQSFFMSTTVQP
jgi:hypothetical protein